MTGYSLETLSLWGTEASMADCDIRPVRPDDRDWVRTFVAEHWGAETIVAHGVVYHPHQLLGFIAVQSGERIGLVTYRFKGDSCEIVSLNSVRTSVGVGTALVEAVKRHARVAGRKRVWLITTNDNLQALRFYQKRGFVLVAVHRDALETSRRLKPEIPLIGLDGIPLRDEIELEVVL